MEALRATHCGQRAADARANLFWGESSFRPRLFHPLPGARRVQCVDEPGEGCGHRGPHLRTADVCTGTDARRPCVWRAARSSVLRDRCPWGSLSARAHHDSGA